MLEIIINLKNGNSYSATRIFSKVSPETIAYLQQIGLEIYAGDYLEICTGNRFVLIAKTEISSIVQSDSSDLPL